MRQMLRRLKLRLEQDQSPFDEDVDGYPLPTHRLFTRRPQHKYAEHKAERDQVFTHNFPNWQSHSDRETVLPLANIPRRTISKWHQKWSKDKSWRPWNRRRNCGTHNRLCTDQAEDEIMATILSDDLDPGKQFTCQTFRAVVTLKWAELGRDPDAFPCSDKLVSGFRKRHGLSSRSCHLRRRDPDGTKEDIERWMEKMQQLFAEHQSRGTRDMLVNCDETA
jgi:hypothetical protein